MWTAFRSSFSRPGTEPCSNETLQVIEGMGELHLDIIVDRLRREFNVECNVGAPQVCCLYSLCVFHPMSKSRVLLLLVLFPLSGHAGKAGRSRCC